MHIGVLLLLSHFSHVRLCDPIDGSLQGSSVPGILQARTLEWVAISFSNAWKWKVKVKSFSRVQHLATPWTAAHQAPPSMGFSRQEYWSGLPLPSPTVMFYSFQCTNLSIFCQIYSQESYPFWCHCNWNCFLNFIQIVHCHYKADFVYWSLFWKISELIYLLIFGASNCNGFFWGSCGYKIISTNTVLLLNFQSGCLLLLFHAQLLWLDPPSTMLNKSD